MVGRPGGAETRIAQLEREIECLRQELARRHPAARTEPDLVQRVLSDPRLLESIFDVITMYDREQRFLYVNRTVGETRVSDVIGTCALDYMAEPDRTRFREGFERAWTCGKPEHVTVETLEGLTWETRLAPIHEGGQVTCMLGTSIDVTLRAHAQASLSESESRLRLAIEASGMGTWTWDVRGNRLAWDDALCRIFGVGTSPPETYEAYRLLIHPDDRERVVAAIERCLTTGVYDDLEHRLVRPDGETRHIVCKGICLRDAQGRIAKLHGTVSDLTDRKQLEEQYQQAKKMDAVGQLTAGIAHNFNNLLSIILPNVLLCREESNLHPRVRERLSEVEYASERAAEMVRQLMLFARPGSTARRSPLDLGETARRTLEMCRITFPQQIVLLLEVEPDTAKVSANPVQMEQVFLNICLNARDALLSAATPQPSIRIRVEPGRPSWVRVRISDNGPGMDEQTRSRIFEPFFTTKEVGRGTGLGLASAYAIVTDHAGRIQCESSPGKGTVLELELPAEAAR